MANGEGSGSGKKILLIVLSVLLLGGLCCGGLVTWGVFEAKQMAEEMAAEMEGMTPEERATFIQEKFGGLAIQYDPTVDPFLADLRDGDIDSAYAACSADMKATLTKEQMAKLQRTIDRVMGGYQSKALKNLNHRIGMDDGDTVELVFFGTYEKGQAEIAITLKEGPGGVFEVQLYKVSSPLFMEALAGDDEAK